MGGFYDQHWGTVKPMANAHLEKGLGSLDFTGVEWLHIVAWAQRKDTARHGAW